MLKNIKNGLNHMNPKHIHLPRRKGSKGDSEGGGSENGRDTNSHSISSPPNVAVGPKVIPAPSMPPGKLPPGAIVKGPPPPGVKVVKGPPPGEGMKVLSGGAGFVSPTRPGAGSPMAHSVGGTPPAGVKVMAHLPPGAKVMQGPPPPGVKVMQGAPPPGVKVVHGAPPPGAKIILSSPPQGSLRPSSPSVVGTNAVPPGVKIFHGPPPPGSRPISPENVRTLTGNSSLIPSRSVSPTNPPVYRILPNGVKVIAGPPPANALVKMVSKSPPGSTSVPTPPRKSPPKKMLIKSMVSSSSPPPMIQAPALRAPSPNASQLIPQNSSFSLGPPPAASQATQNLPRPTPVRPAATLVKVAPPPSDYAASNPDTNSSLPVPHPKAISSRSGSQQELNFEEEGGGTDASDGDDIQFEEDASASPQQVPRKSPPVPPPAPKALSGDSSSSSSASSFSIKPDPDEATALPSAHKGNEDPPSSAASIHGSRASKPVSEPKSTNAKKRSHRSSSGSGAAGAATADRGANNDKKGGRKSSHKHHHHHHHSQSSETSSQQSYRVPPPPAAAFAGAALEKRASRHSSPGQQVAKVQEDTYSDESSGRYGDQLSEAAFIPQALTSTSRNRIAEDFLSMLCPQQYYGKVKKINRIRPFKANRAAVTGLRSCNSIYVATKGTMPNPYFYPQLRLRDTDGEQPMGLSGEETSHGAVDTPIILYEAAPGNMLFAETELDARRLLENSPGANSCFMLSNSAILFKDPEHYVLPIASLNVHWVPYASPQSEPQCPIHKNELQLFDPYSKELVCALCASRNGVPMSNFVVIPDVLGSVDSRQRIQAKVSAQLDEAQQSARRWVDQHQRVRELCENKKSAICNQFDLLIEALTAKKREYTEACEAEFAYAQTDVAREILITDEKVQLLKAASDHLRTDPSRPLFSMQIATIAESLSAAADLPSRFTRSSLRLPPMSTGLVPNLEGVMAQVLELSPSVGVGGSAGGGGSRSRPRSVSPSNSPYHNHHVSVLNRSRRPVDDTVIMAGDGPRRRSGQAVSPGPSAALNGQPQPPQPSPRSTSVNPPHRTTPLRDDSSAILNSTPSQRRSANGMGLPSAYATDAVSVPNSTGTSLFDFALHDLLSTFDASNVKKRSPRYIQWAIRVEDPGDWVGLGVGVGNTIDAWEQGSTNDLSHLWIVPASMTGHVLYLRVSVQPSSGHAKLTVHDARGKQVDAGEVPQWNAARPSYPQATFGGQVGTVRMIEVPHAVK
jgi:hypothetical protein